MSSGDPPRSPTLLPPRKSVELEDPGAHELDSSNDEDDVFADAQDTLMSPTVPVTRVEKVDDEPSHGQVPGTAAYEMRTQDAVPDEITVVPEGASSISNSRRGSGAPLSPGGSPVPKTVVEKVDDTPSHGEVPGTAAHQKRLADAVPDSIVKAQAEAMSSPSPSSGGATSPGSPIPRTVVTRVNSDPSYGEVPERGEHDSSYFDQISSRISRDATSPIAADGGFGPMDYDEDDESEDNGGDTIAPNTLQISNYEQKNTGDLEESDDEEDGFGDDFDDFEDGAEGDDDFGDFDDGFAQQEQEPVSAPKQSITSAVPSLPVLDLTDSHSLPSILSSADRHLAELFPDTESASTSPPPPLPDSSSTFLTERSLSLWSQLVAPPPLQPRNWVRSRIRRLFLVSLGVPVDLDEILPKSKQKKLVLNYTSSTGPPGSAPQGPAARLRNDADNASDSATSNFSGGKGGAKKGPRRKGPAPPPEFDVDAVRKLCDTTDNALEGMSGEELRQHVKKLEDLVDRGKDVLQYWVRRKEAAVGEKEAFDGVIENLVRHARRVRK